MLIPRHRVFSEFLSSEEHAKLLDYALASRNGFAAAKVYDDGSQIISEAHRSAEKLAGGLGPLKQIFLARVNERLPELFAEAGVPPKPVTRFETEVVAHNDGGRFGRHVDTLTGQSRKEAGDAGVRAVSGVYYFYRKPKAFEGGQLRIFAFGGDGFIDIEPEENAFVIFPSFAAHEVLPVTVPSSAFEDSRFSVNCWVHCLLE